MTLRIWVNVAADFGVICWQQQWVTRLFPQFISRKTVKCIWLTFHARLPALRRVWSLSYAEPIKAWVSPSPAVWAPPLSRTTILASSCQRSSREVRPTWTASCSTATKSCRWVPGFTQRSYFCVVRTWRVQVFHALCRSIRKDTATFVLEVCSASICHGGRFSLSMCQADCPGRKLSILDYVRLKQRFPTFLWPCTPSTFLSMYP